LLELPYGNKNCILDQFVITFKNNLLRCSKSKIALTSFISKAFFAERRQP